MSSFGERRSQIRAYAREKFLKWPQGAKFVCIFGAVETWSLRKLWTQQIRKIIRTSLCLLCLCDAAMQGRNIFNVVFVEQNGSFT